MITITKKSLPWLVHFLRAYWHQFHADFYDSMAEALADFHSIMPQDVEQAFIHELAPIATDPAMIAFMNRRDSMHKLGMLGGGMSLSGDDIRFIHDYLVKNRRFPPK